MPCAYLCFCWWCFYVLVYICHSEWEDILLLNHICSKQEAGEQYGTVSTQCLQGQRTQLIWVNAAWIFTGPPESYHLKLGFLQLQKSQLHTMIDYVTLNGQRMQCISWITRLFHPCISLFSDGMAYYWITSVLWHCRSLSKSVNKSKGDSMKY